MFACVAPAPEYVINSTSTDVQVTHVRYTDDGYAKFRLLNKVVTSLFQ